MLQHNSRLGEVWKVCGGSPELGGWFPEVAPALSWNDGGIWSAEIALPPGTYSFKCMLRRADGSYIWETGENRHLVVSGGTGLGRVQGWWLVYRSSGATWFTALCVPGGHG